MERERATLAALRTASVRREVATERRAAAESRAVAARLRWELAELRAVAVAVRLERAALRSAQPVAPSLSSNGPGRVTRAGSRDGSR